MEIETQSLTTCEVAPDGGAISLGFGDRRAPRHGQGVAQPGRRARHDAARADRQALQARFGDQSLRYAYPLASWAIEQSTDPTQGMITLSTEDGFNVCFSIPRAQQSELGEALTASSSEGDRHGELACAAPQYMTLSRATDNDPETSIDIKGVQTWL